MDDGFAQLFQHLRLLVQRGELGVDLLGLLVEVAGDVELLKVIKDTTQRLEAIPNVKVTDNSQFTKLLIPYPERSAQLDRRYVFAVSGSGVETVWKSPELMTEITRQIIDGCYGVAAVTFGRDRTGDSATVGKFPDGSIKKFTCGADFDRHTRTRPPLSWGQQVCDI